MSRELAHDSAHPLLGFSSLWVHLRHHWACFWMADILIWWLLIYFCLKLRARLTV